MKKFNLNEFLWFIILVAFAYYIYVLFQTMKIKAFIHPKMFKYTLFSGGVFIVLAIFQIRKIFSYAKIKRIKLGYLIFLIPLFLAFTVNPDSLSAQIAAQKKGADISDHNLNNLDPLRSETNTNNSDPGDYDKSGGAEFLNALMAVSANSDRILGQEVELAGFVFRETDFQKNNFVIARLIMACCAADVQVVGLLCEWDQGSEVADNEWIKVTGTVQKTTRYNRYSKQEETVPLLKVSKIARIEPPVDQYIYP
ncbi:MAG: TIGR03943 family putative permease subunit [Peptococcaceae bacterium]